MDSKHRSHVSESRRKNAIIAFLIFNIIGLVTFIVLERDLHQSTSSILSGNPGQYAQIYKPLDLLSEYVSSNYSVATSHWESFNRERGWVQLSHIYAQQHEMTPGLYLPDDPDMGLFILDGYHQMHCLMAVRDALYALHHNEKPPSREIHWRHCLDYLRQAIICRADDTPISTKHMNGSMRTCRSWSKMDEWANDHKSCWMKVENVWTKKESCK